MAITTRSEFNFTILTLRLSFPLLQPLQPAELWCRVYWHVVQLSHTQISTGSLEGFIKTCDGDVWFVFRYSINQWSTIFDEIIPRKTQRDEVRIQQVTNTVSFDAGFTAELKLQQVGHLYVLWRMVHYNVDVWRFTINGRVSDRLFPLKQAMMDENWTNTLCYSLHVAGNYAVNKQKRDILNSSLP